MLRVTVAEIQIIIDILLTMYYNKVQMSHRLK